MAFFDRQSLNPGVAPREVLAWATYDFANSGYTTVVLTAVFNAYFVAGIAGNAPWATLAWTVALAVSYALVMLTAPALGAWADVRGSKKRLLVFSTVGCIAGTLVLSLAQPGMVVLAMLAIIVSNYFFSLGEGLIAAFLPELARPEAVGKVSGWGWSFGYFGGMLTLGICLAIVLSAQASGTPASVFVPQTLWVTAGVFALAALPTFLILRERPVRGAPRPDEPERTLDRLRRTWGESARFQDFRRLLACGCFYQAGIAVVIALAAVYAEQVMHFTKVQTMALIFIVNIASALGAFLFGYVQDRLGHRRALALTLYGWLLMTALAALGRSPELFWGASLVAGLCMGSSQSGGRALVAVLAPPERSAEFFGLWSLATRLASIVGPVTYGLVTWLTEGNHRLAIGITSLFFVGALLVLRTLDVARGSAAARG